ncbi:MULTISPECIES: aminoglycoside 6-adenylyltransferase [Niallia]|jgi:aminoglycoside 6-adenylyltransferase|uniref:Aminoglycoside adenylyltransferase n=1 Tax=Niallia circulans TaxID=1397 RepID=A0A0J1L2N1_NIACI|nr:aminoglycoside 6-adenylyltransferase [Niallia circulans]KLV23265.1 aminoglycoside adenylyltransferase [Niallia circulans]MED5101242.1 aminoglycoside 6-adenylyltransferase [Niallia circulans]
MRTEKQILDLVLKVANQDKRVRAVCMNGSRTNPNVPKDAFQDFDIVYLVDDMESFLNEPNWIDVFGKRIIMQTPEDSSLFPAELGGRFSYLMLFTDGNRIDLTLVPLEEKNKYCQEDGLTVILLDKDNSLPCIPPSTDKDYWVKKPTAEQFSDCCNEFWWVSTYVVKGLWRREILYAIDHMNIIRVMLLKMLEWKVGIETDFSLSVGKNSKYLKQYIDDDTWKRLMHTYPSGDYSLVWKSLFSMTALFEEIGLEVGRKMDFLYPLEEAEGVKAYLNHVRQLKPNAAETAF